MTHCGCEVNKKEQYTCSLCNQLFCGKHIYFYIDESNIAITRNSKPHCETCYKIKYKK